MVTNVKEHGTVKCEKYWPEGEQSLLSGVIQVILEDQIILSDYVIRTLQLKVSFKWLVTSCII